MESVSNKLRPRDWAVVSLGVAVVLVLEVGKSDPFWATAPAATVTSQEAFARWRSTAEGGAAFAVGADGAFGWSDNHPHVDAARRFAIAYCEVKSAGKCQIKEARDEGVFVADLDRVVSPKLARRYETFQAYSGAKALALNDDGYYGYFYGAKTLLGAKMGAKAKCEQYKGGYPEGIPPEPCKVVYASW